MSLHTFSVESISLGQDTIQQVLGLPTDAKRLIAADAWQCPSFDPNEITGQRHITSLLFEFLQGKSAEPLATALLSDVISVGLENHADLIADFYYQPAERMTREYPGCSESMTLECASLATVDITYCLSDSDRESLEEYALSKIHEEQAADAAEERQSWRTGT